MRRIIKVAENNVEIQNVLVDPDNNAEVITERDAYGQERIDREREVLEKQLHPDTVSIQAKLDELDDIQTEMDK